MFQKENNNKSQMLQNKNRNIGLTPLGSIIASVNMATVQNMGVICPRMSDQLCHAHST